MPPTIDASNDLLMRVRENLTNRDAVVTGPFGQRALVYADDTASGRSLDFIESHIARHVLPFYANTHTETSFTGLQTTRFREGARRAIRAAVGATDDHAVIFCGSGATAAVNKLACALGLRDHAPRDNRPVVFVGPYEHHSNDLIWRESSVIVERIPLDADGGVCMATLADRLSAHAGAPMRIGSFSAASNVTGVRTDMRALAALLHRHDAHLFADYAAAGPYVHIDMAESAPGAADHIDAIFLSPHKFVGGPGASGVLVANKTLFSNAIPSVPGGGTVAYVSAGRHRYVSDIERREEAGTPAILGDIRAGLALQLKADIGPDRIETIERNTVARVRAAWSATPGIDILGPADADRLAIFSFNIRHADRCLHPNFVVALLNDLFGIQARGGCSCAGPYAHALLDISNDQAERYDALIAAGEAVYRPGWVRLNFNAFIDEATIETIIAAVRFIARRGADCLGLYACNPASGRWRAKGAIVAPDRDFADLCTWDMPQAAGSRPTMPDLAHMLASAEDLADRGHALLSSCDTTGHDHADRWFTLAADAA